MDVLEGSCARVAEKLSDGRYSGPEILVIIQILAPIIIEMLQDCRRPDEEVAKDLKKPRWGQRVMAQARIARMWRFEASEEGERFGLLKPYRVARLAVQEAMALEEAECLELVRECRSESLLR